MNMNDWPLAPTAIGGAHTLAVAGGKRLPLLWYIAAEYIHLLYEIWGN